MKNSVDQPSEAEMDVHCFQKRIQKVESYAHGAIIILL